MARGNVYSAIDGPRGGHLHDGSGGPLIRESVDADAQYMQYLSKSRITSPQTHKKLI